jgi:hypothetical protein
MIADINLQVLPYESVSGNSLLQILIQEFNSNKWKIFKSAVAFASQSANYGELLDALETFAKNGGSISMTFGADVFAGKAKGTEYDALKTIIEKIENFPNVCLYIYHEKGRTFHPKIYLFANDENALLIVGSSNWTDGGLTKNIEANVIINLNLTNADHQKLHGRICMLFNEYWKEIT